MTVNLSLYGCMHAVSSFLMAHQDIIGYSLPAICILVWYLSDQEWYYSFKQNEGVSVWNAIPYHPFHSIPYHLPALEDTFPVFTPG